MTPSYFSFGRGLVTFWDVGDLDPERPPMDQLEELKEDLVQVAYGDRIVLDIGWYPSFDLDGRFVVVVTRDQDWVSPLFSAESATWKSLNEAVDRAVGFASALAWPPDPDASNGPL